jgi:hypothetical protein
MRALLTTALLLVLLLPLLFMPVYWLLGIWSNESDTERKLQRVSARIEVESRMLLALIAGDLTLREALDHIRQQRTASEFESLCSQLRPHVEGESADERLGRYLIKVIREHFLLDQPEEQAAVIARLQTDLASCLRQSKKVR